jgi:dihydroceramidase
MPQQVATAVQSTEAAYKMLRILVTMIVLTILPLFAMLVVRGPVDGTGDKGTGFWGTKTATVNWCEADYVVTHYIAEFANTISSLAIIGNGVYGIYRHWGTVEPKFIAAYASFIVIGAGSAGFHGTLWRSLQLMDELPMVWANSIFLYILLTMDDKKAQARGLERCAIVVVTVLASLAIMHFDEAAAGQDLFLVTYGTGVVYLVARSRTLNFEYNSRRVHILLETMLLFYAGGFALWLVDRNFCRLVRSLHLHAFWHLGAGVGTYSGVLFWIWVRNEKLERKQRILGGVPGTQWVECGSLDKVL